MAKGTSLFNAIQSLPQIRRNAGRFADVVGILAKHGLASWLHKGHPDFIKNRFKTADGTRIVDLSTNENIRVAITELGPAWIKLGQVMSTRPDLVGPDLAEELEQLQTRRWS